MITNLLFFFVAPSHPILVILFAPIFIVWENIWQSILCFRHMSTLKSPLTKKILFDTLKWFVLTFSTLDESIAAVPAGLPSPSLPFPSCARPFPRNLVTAFSVFCCPQTVWEWAHSGEEQQQWFPTYCQFFFFVFFCWHCGQKRRCIHYPVITPLLVLWYIIHYMASPRSTLTGLGRVHAGNRWAQQQQARGVSAHAVVINT